MTFSSLLLPKILPLRDRYLRVSTFLGPMTTMAKDPHEGKLNLKDGIYFPRSAFDLPEVGYDEDDTMRFYTGPMTEPLQPLFRTFRTDKKIHWCFIGERVPSPVKGPGMISLITRPVNPLERMVNLRATNGEAILFDVVTGREDWRGDWPDSLLPQLLPKFKMGYIIAAMYACRTSGLNLAVQRREMVQIFPCGLERLYSLAETISAPKPEICLCCEKPASLVCSRCKLGPYCSKPCQNKDWRDGHKDECRVVERLREWSVMDWSVYDKDRLLN
ncbi:hypothetical protein DFH06DRAFT_519925 [Mycena polygramma]|nr:hypothetical protein DFH06DRAFT_519925 [Mycena polygramma]